MPHFSSKVWTAVLTKCNANWQSTNWLGLIEVVARDCLGKSLATIIKRLGFCCTVYQIWMERNSRIFSRIFCRALLAWSDIGLLPLKISNSLGLIAGFFKSGGCLQSSLNIEGSGTFCGLSEGEHLLRVEYRMMKPINESCEFSKSGLSDGSQKLSANGYSNLCWERSLMDNNFVLASWSLRGVMKTQRPGSDGDAEKVGEVRRQRKGNKGYFGLHKGGDERDSVPYLDRGEMMEESEGGRCSSEMAWAAEILRKGVAFLCSWISQEGRFNVLFGEPQRLFKPSQQGTTLIK
ncbi:unnamed protein product [Camellia sinensis]